jgi:hypothetical protein
MEPFASGAHAVRTAERINEMAILSKEALDASATGRIGEMAKVLLWVAVLIAMTTLIAMTSSSWAVDPSVTDEEEKGFSAPAREAYRKGLGALDHIRPDKAIEAFTTAQKIDTRNLPIRFLVARLAVSEGKKKMGDEAIGLFRIAETAYNEILAMQNKGAKPSEIRRAQLGQETVKDLIIKQAERDAKRMKVRDRLLMKGYHQGAREGIVPPAEQKQRIEEAKRQQEYAQLGQTARYIENLIAQRYICIGMTSEQVLRAWGAPVRYNRTVSPNHVREQWVYEFPGNTYLYFHDGILTSYHEYR